MPSCPVTALATVTTGAATGQAVDCGEMVSQARWPAPCRRLSSSSRRWLRLASCGPSPSTTSCGFEACSTCASRPMGPRSPTSCRRHHWRPTRIRLRSLWFRRRRTIAAIGSECACVRQRYPRRGCDGSRWTRGVVSGRSRESSASIRGSVDGGPSRAVTSAPQGVHLRVGARRQHLAFLARDAAERRQSCAPARLNPRRGSGCSRLADHREAHADGQYVDSLSWSPEGKRSPIRRPASPVSWRRTSPASMASRRWPAPGSL